MSMLSDTKIELRATRDQMIEPFVNYLERYAEDGKPIISYGLSSYGYDARLSNEFVKVTATNTSEFYTREEAGGTGEILEERLYTYPNPIVDPKRMGPPKRFKTGMAVIPPGDMLLGKTVEWFKMPRDLMAICLGKSTYARCGLLVNVTPLEPEWEGHVTLELSNVSQSPVKVYAGEGICQFVFFEATNTCRISYADRKGKYQGQVGVTVAKM